MKNLSMRAAGVSPSLTLEITAKAKQLKASGKPVVSFGAGEPDFNTPKYIVDAAKWALDAGYTKYTPASGTEALKQAVAEKLRRDNGLSYEPRDIVISCGAKHSLYNAFMVLIDPGDEVIIPSPYWLTYPELVKLCGGTPVFVPTLPADGFKMTPDQLKAALTPRTKAVLINNPCNPTGAVYSHSEIRALAAVLEETDVYVISDEIYEKLVYEDELPLSIAAVSPELFDRTIVVNGVSKTYAMTGWRIGYTASNPTLAKAMGSIQSHTTSNPNSIAQYAATEAYLHAEGEAFLTRMKQIFDRRRRYMIDTLAKIEAVQVIPPKGAFYVMVGIEHLLGKKSARGVRIDGAHAFANEFLDTEMVATIPTESFGAPGYLRLSYATGDEDIALGLDRFADFVRSLHD